MIVFYDIFFTFSMQNKRRTRFCADPPFIYFMLFALLLYKTNAKCFCLCEYSVLLAWHSVCTICIVIL